MYMYMYALLYELHKQVTVVSSSLTLLLSHNNTAMATLARHVIANEYSLADDSVKTVTSDSHEGTPHSDDPRTRLEESGREDSPSSTSSSSHEPCDSTVVSTWYIYSCIIRYKHNNNVTIRREVW